MSIANQLQEDELFLVDYMNMEKAANCMQLNGSPKSSISKKNPLFFFYLQIKESLYHHQQQQVLSNMMECQNQHSIGRRTNLYIVIY